jgi:AcrR family transcriptional regulator
LKAEVDQDPENGRAKLRERLLLAAEAAISSGGVQGLKARDIARNAGCALGAIYNVFEDLDELILRVGARTLALLEAALVSKPAPGVDATDELVRLARAYLEFARAHKLRWRALFEHRLSEGRQAPHWFVADQDRLFLLLEKPLEALLSSELPQDRALLARTLFSAVHGIVSLGLEEKLTPMNAGALDEQLERMTRAFARGLNAKN